MGSSYISIEVNKYYSDKFFKSMPEVLFDILDEAYFRKKTWVRIRKTLMNQFENNKAK